MCSIYKTQWCSLSHSFIFIEKKKKEEPQLVLLAEQQQDTELCSHHWTPHPIMQSEPVALQWNSIWLLVSVKTSFKSFIAKSQSKEQTLKSELCLWVVSRLWLNAFRLHFYLNYRYDNVRPSVFCALQGHLVCRCLSPAVSERQICSYLHTFAFLALLVMKWNGNTDWFLTSLIFLTFCWKKKKSPIFLFFVMF